MRRLTYKQKLLLNFTLLFAVFTALLVIFQYNRERQYKHDLLDSRLQSYADMVASATEYSDTVNYDTLLHVLPADLRLTVIGRRGKVRFESTHHAVDSMDNHLDRPEVRAANASGSAKAVADVNKHHQCNGK